jgi:ubiquinol-cytochrome c reductase cytochrome b subunit
MREAFFGGGFSDFILRFYAFHVFWLPIAMLGLMVVHFPRFLVFDVPMVMAFSGAIMITGGVFPVDLGLKFDPNVPPGITVPEWYLTGLYAFLRTMYDKFVTGVLWPGLFIFTLLIIPFVDRYKKFSWKDRPLITAVGITSLAQIIVTTYWGFYIDPDIQKSLLERLVIDPIFFYVVMVLLVPLSFGFTYMMIKLAKNAESKAKAQPKKATGKGPINLPAKWVYIIFIGLLIFQIYLNISAYYAVVSGMNNFSLFVIGLMMLVFAGMFHIYRHGRAMEKAPPPLPPKPAIQPKAPSPLPQTSQPAFAVEPGVAKPLAPQQAQKAKPSIGSSQNPNSPSLRTGGHADGSNPKEAGISQNTNSSTKMDSLNKTRNERMG